MSILTQPRDMMPSKMAFPTGFIGATLYSPEKNYDLWVEPSVARCGVDPLSLCDWGGLSLYHPAPESTRLAKSFRYPSALLLLVMAKLTVQNYPLATVLQRAMAALRSRDISRRLLPTILCLCVKRSCWRLPCRGRQNVKEAVRPIVAGDARRDECETQSLIASCAFCGIRHRSFYGMLFVIPFALGLAMLVYIPDGTPHVRRSMMDDTNYLSDIHSFFEVWYDSHHGFPKDEAEFHDALRKGPAAWQFRVSSPPVESDYSKNGERLPYEVKVIGGATGPKLDGLAERPE